MLNKKLTPRSLLPPCRPRTLHQSGQDQRDWQPWRQNQRGETSEKSRFTKHTDLHLADKTQL